MLTTHQPKWWCLANSSLCFPRSLHSEFLSLCHSRRMTKVSRHKSRFYLCLRWVAGRLCRWSCISTDFWWGSLERSRSSRCQRERLIFLLQDTDRLLRIWTIYDILADQVDPVQVSNHSTMRSQWLYYHPWNLSPWCMLSRKQSSLSSHWQMHWANQMIVGQLGSHMLVLEKWYRCQLSSM